MAYTVEKVTPKQFYAAGERWRKEDGSQVGHSYTKCIPYSSDKDETKDYHAFKRRKDLQMTLVGLNWRNIEELTLDQLERINNILDEQN